MDQLSFSDAEYAVKRKQTRREKFLQEMEQVVPWARLERIIEPYYPKAGNGRHSWPPPRCCESIVCSSGMDSVTRRRKTPCTRSPRKTQDVIREAGL